MNNEVKAVAIIPAKLDSRRLKNKNIQRIFDKTLIEHTIDYALNFNEIKLIIVSTESKIIRDLIKEKYNDKLDVICIYHRPEHLLGNTDTMDVYVDVIKDLSIYNKEAFNNFTHIVGLQPDHPDRKINISNLFKYFIEKDYDDLVTVDKDGFRNGSIRLTKGEHIKSNNVSRKIGCILDDCTNIHTKEDLKLAKRKMIGN